MGTVLRCNEEQTPESGMETSDIAGKKKISNSIVSSKTDVDTFGTYKGQFWNTIRRGAQRGTTVNSAHYSEGSGA
jgi:hypothetical protein